MYRGNNRRICIGGDLLLDKRNFSKMTESTPAQQTHLRGRKTPKWPITVKGDPLEALSN